MLSLLCIAASVSLRAHPASASDEHNDTGWALTRVSVACVREQPQHSAELGSQIIMGTPVKLLDQEAGWWKVETPEGYTGYVIGNSLTPLTDSAMEKWKGCSRVVVTSGDQTYIYDTCIPNPLNRVSDVVNGSILIKSTNQRNSSGTDYVAVKLPDGRQGYIASGDVTDLEDWAATPCHMDSVVSFACRHMGVPYLWGGTSSKSMDCSGLSKIAYLSQGVILPRNASQQAKIGGTVQAVRQMQPGDLLFFGNRRSGKVNHVGMYVGNGRFIHSSGRVRVSALSPDEPDYESLYMITARHLSSNDLQKMSIKKHPWFFN